mmetsp:Transcript_1065/g.3381  ORF Transcript_1065/g.3381 Transcript_1065/m.3381 type:complete len:265 (-) Transcript_1065:910-1704(-)
MRGWRSTAASTAANVFTGVPFTASKRSPSWSTLYVGAPGMTRRIDSTCLFCSSHCASTSAHFRLSPNPAPAVEPHAKLSESGRSSASRKYRPGSAGTECEQQRGDSCAAEGAPAGGAVAAVGGEAVGYGPGLASAGAQRAETASVAVGKARGLIRSRVGGLPALLSEERNAGDPRSARGGSEGDVDLRGRGLGIADTGAAPSGLARPAPPPPAAVFAPPLDRCAVGGVFPNGPPPPPPTPPATASLAPLPQWLAIAGRAAALAA